MNYYEELGVSPSAPAEEIRQAYWELARLLDPDQHREEGLRRAQRVGLGALFRGPGGRRQGVSGRRRESLECGYTAAHKFRNMRPRGAGFGVLRGLQVPGNGERRAEARRSTLKRAPRAR